MLLLKFLFLELLFFVIEDDEDALLLLLFFGFLTAPRFLAWGGSSPDESLEKVDSLAENDSESSESDELGSATS